MMSQRDAENPSRRQLTVVFRHIDDNLENPLTIDELARLLEISPFHFARLFKLATGRPPHRYIIERRIRRAQDLLTHSWSSISDIAYRIGFSSQSHMTTVFRKQAGATPRTFRRPHADDQYKNEPTG